MEITRIITISKRALDSSIFLGLVFGAALIGIEFFSFKYLGVLSIGLIIIISSLIFIRDLGSKHNAFVIERNDLKLFSPLLLWLIVYIYSLRFSAEFEDVYIILELFSIIILLLVVYRYGLQLYPNRLMLFCILVLVAINLFSLFLQSGGNIFVPSRAPGIFVHRNTMATTVYYLMLYYVLYFISKGEKVNRIGLLFFILAIYLANSRAILGALIVFLTVYYGWYKITKYRILYYGSLYTFVIVLVLFIILMTGELNDIFPEAKLLNLYFRTYTGGQLHSGRDDIWPAIMEQIFQRPFFGYGPAHKPSRFMDTRLSSHNYYLQVIMQSGVIGFGLLLIFLTKIWKSFRVFKGDPVIRFLAAAILSAIYHQIFVVSLTQNNMEQAVFFWVFVGLALNRRKSLANDKR